MYIFLEYWIFELIIYILKFRYKISKKNFIYKSENTYSSSRLLISNNHFIELSIFISKLYILESRIRININCLCKNI